MLTFRRFLLHQDFDWVTPYLRGVTELQILKEKQVTGFGIQWLCT
jgi:hypothetical protein